MLNLKDNLESWGVEIVRDDGHEITCYCPFHNNTDSPAFSINKSTGLWICFNPACGRKGSLKDLTNHFGGSVKITPEYTLSDIERNLMQTLDEAPSDDWSAALESIKLNKKNIHLGEFLTNRGLENKTLYYFEIGFSEKRGRIVIPCRDDQSRLVGFIGRATHPNVQPKYLYSKSFPRKYILFNLNHAKKYDTAIVVEGSVDAMKVHQAGFPNVVSTLGAAVSEEHIALLKKHFDKIIIFSDDDDAGRAMAESIQAGCAGMDVLTVEYSGGGAKDPGDMTSEEIADAISSAKDSLQAAIASLYDDVV